MLILIIILFIYILFYHRTCSYFNGSCTTKEICEAQCGNNFDYHVDFNQFKGQFNTPLDPSQFKQLFGMSISNTNCVIDGNHDFVVKILPCQIQSGSGISTKIIMKKGEQLPLKIKEMYLQYNVRFGSSFNWGMGGKLPGIGLGNSPTGCTTNIKGMSVRPMWRGYNNDNSIYNPGVCKDMDTYKAYIYLYLYRRGDTKKCGVYYYCRDTDGYEIKKDEWYVITYKIICNEMGKKDGKIKMFINGEQVFYINNVELLTTDCPKDEQNWVYQLSCFRGGSGDEWGIERDDQEISFGNFRMTSDYELLTYPIKEDDKENAIENDKLGGE